MATIIQSTDETLNINRSFGHTGFVYPITPYPNDAEYLSEFNQKLIGDVKKVYSKAIKLDDDIQIDSKYICSYDWVRSRIDPLHTQTVVKKYIHDLIREQYEAEMLNIWHVLWWKKFHLVNHSVYNIEHIDHNHFAIDISFRMNNKANSDGISETNFVSKRFNMPNENEGDN